VRSAGAGLGAEEASLGGQALGDQRRTCSAIQPLGLHGERRSLEASQAPDGSLTAGIEPGATLTCSDRADQQRSAAGSLPARRRAQPATGTSSCLDDTADQDEDAG